jgi:hypothetical protein
MTDRYFRFIRECATLRGVQDTDEERAMLKDHSWFFCFDDGMTAQEAVNEYRKKVETH